MTRWHIGCSGFHYKHWKGGFFPIDLPQKKWFEFYNNSFQTLELNVTFYRFPRLNVLENWYEKSAPQFRFSVKAPRAITHFKQFINCKPMLDDFYGVVREGLKEKVGCVLFQLPPRITYKAAKLEQIIGSMDPGLKNVIEFRHESWWNAEVYTTLAKRDIGFCGQSHPLLPQDIIQNGKVLYYRFHGIPELYKSPYSEEQLRAFADEIKANKNVKEVYVYFNNDIEVSAIKNALFLKSYVEDIKKASTKLKTLS